jgi:hypothetical protein
MAGHSGGPDGVVLAIIGCIGDCALDAADSACLESVAHGGSGRLPLSVSDSAGVARYQLQSYRRLRLEMRRLQRAVPRALPRLVVDCPVIKLDRGVSGDVHMAMDHEEYQWTSPVVLWLRLPLQGSLILWAYWYTGTDRSNECAPTRFVA